MSLKQSMTKNQGFTIVELLIVVIVIAILATITLVSFNNITSRANQSAADSAVASFIKKAELYAADGSTGLYPASFGVLNDTTKSYHMTSGVVGATAGTFLAPAAQTAAAALTAAGAALSDDAGKNNVAVWSCASGGNVTGLNIYSRRYVANTSPAQAVGSVNLVRTLGTCPV